MSDESKLHVAGKKVGDAISWPFRKIIGAFTSLILSAVLLIWLTAYVGEKLTGIEMLPSPIAPARKAPRDQIQDDERDCIMYIVLVDTKAHGSNDQLDRKIIEMVFNHKEYYHVSACVILHEMRELVASGEVRVGVPNREDWYLYAEFLLEAKRKRALRAMIEDLRTNPDQGWYATQLIRPDRGRTLGNQTEAEKQKLRDTMDPIPQDPLDRGFLFFKPKPKAK